MAYQYDPKESKKRQQEQYNQMKKTLENVLDSYKEDPRLVLEYLKFKSNFHSYSVRNTVLIRKQNPYVTVTGSFKHWEKLGYHIKREERGLKIFVPVKSKMFQSVSTEGSKETKPVKAATGEEEEGIKQGRIPTFDRTSYKVGYVFDISQTDCPPEAYPKLFSVGYASKPHAELYEGVKNFAKRKGISVGEANLQSISLRGTFAPLSKTITINDRLNDTQKLDTLLHEMGHAILSEIDGQRTEGSFKNLAAYMEAEADAVSLMLHEHLGMEVSDTVKRHFVVSCEQLKRVGELDIGKLLNEVSKAYDGFREELDSGLKELLLEQPEIKNTNSQPTAGVLNDQVLVSSDRKQQPADMDKNHYLRTRRGQSDRPLYEASREQLDQLKRDVSILTVAEDLGYHPVRGGGVHWSLEEHDSVQFYLDTNTYTQFSKGEGGSVIDFTMHLGDMEKRDAIRWLKEQYLSLEASIFPRHPWVPPAETKPVEKKPFVLPEKVQGRFSRAVAYLVKTRCINPEVVRDGIRSGLIYEDNHHNVVFVGKDPDGKPGFATRRGTNTEKPFRGDVVGSDQTLGFKVEGKNAARLYVTEAPIDALSVLTIDKRRGYNTTNATYLATCGTGKTKVVERYLREHPEIREVVLANDNDPAGREANRKLTVIIRSQNPDIIIQEIKPQGNDVNEMLQNSIKAERKTQKKQADPPVDPEQ